MGSSNLADPLVAHGEHGAQTDDDSFVKKVLKPCGILSGAVILLAFFISYAVFCIHFRLVVNSEAELSAYQYTLPWETLALTAATVATVISCVFIGQHLLHNNNKWEVKIPALMIISMVPVYAICSGLSLLVTMEEHNFSVPLSAFREFYESLVLVAFMQFIAEFWGGTVTLAGFLDSDEMTLNTIFPMPVQFADRKLRSCLEKVEPYKHALLDLRVFPFRRIPGSHYVAWTYVGALQYAVVMLLYVTVTMSMWCSSLDSPAKLKITAVLKIIKGASNLCAMYNLLVLFEYLRESKKTHERMNKIRPISKFVCIKLLVIFSLWQEFGMSLLARNDMLPVLRGWRVDWDDEEKSAEAVVNFLVCIEMLLFAMWHRYAYPFNEPWDLDAGVKRKHNPHWSLRWSVLKMADDVGYLLRNRVNGQFKVVHLLKDAKRGKYSDLDLSKDSLLYTNFKYFELDENQEASLVQLQFLLAISGFAQNWDDARNILKRADANNTGRISYEEFRQLIRY